MPASHRLPEFARLFPGYSVNLARLAGAVTAAHPGAPVIDIGANIGDSAVLLRAATTAPVLCVEGDPFWLPYLEGNTHALADVEICVAYVGAIDGEQPFELARAEGTGSLRPAAGGGAVQTTSFDTLLERHPRFSSSCLVKSDTDGFDVSLMTALLSSKPLPNPVLFFEYDPAMTRAAGTDPSSLWPALRDAGYSTALWWDNFGNYLLSSDLDGPLLEQLTSYVPAAGAAVYWDVAAFHADDRHVASALDASEVRRRRP